MRIELNDYLEILRPKCFARCIPALAALALISLSQLSIASLAIETEEASLDVSILDNTGFPLLSASMGSKLSILSNVTNNGATEKTFSYIVQIKDPEDRVIFLSVTPTVIGGTEARTVETLWLTEEEGKHTIQIFVWQQMESPLTFSYYTTQFQINADSGTKVECSGSAACFSGTVTKVTDGDTIDVDNITVRFALVDTPEIGEAGYHEATSFTSKLCAVGSKVLVDEDDGQTAGSYGRMIAKVYCDGRLINEELLESRNAILLTRHCDESEFANEGWAKKFGC